MRYARALKLDLCPCFGTAAFWLEFCALAVDEYTVWCCSGFDIGQADGEGLPFGLVPRHGYSVIKAASVAGFHFLQFRNPWGGGEWTGDWSDKSPLWEQHPDVKAAIYLEDKDDGIFWMERKDILQFLGDPYIHPMVVANEDTGYMSSAVTGVFHCEMTNKVFHNAQNESETAFHTNLGSGDPHELCVGARGQGAERLKGWRKNLDQADTMGPYTGFRSGVCLRLNHSGGQMFYDCQAFDQRYSKGDHTMSLDFYHMIGGVRQVLPFHSTFYHPNSWAGRETVHHRVELGSPGEVLIAIRDANWIKDPLPEKLDYEFYFRMSTKQEKPHELTRKFEDFADYWEDSTTQLVPGQTWDCEFQEFFRALQKPFLASSSPHPRLNPSSMFFCKPFEAAQVDQLLMLQDACGEHKMPVLEGTLDKAIYCTRPYGGFTSFDVTGSINHRLARGENWNSFRPQDVTYRYTVQAFHDPRPGTPKILMLQGSWTTADHEAVRDYWESHYAQGALNGPGSYDQFKKLYKQVLQDVPVVGSASIAAIASAVMDKDLANDLKSVRKTFGLAAWLKDNAFGAFEDGFRNQLSVTEVADLKYVEKEDLTSIGVRGIKQRRFFAAVENLDNDIAKSTMAAQAPPSKPGTIRMGSGDGDWSGATEFEVSCRICTRDNDGAIVGKARQQGDGLGWQCGDGQGECKLLFLRGGHLAFDIGWVGCIGSQVDVADGQQHDVGFRFTSGKYELFVDGVVVGSGLQATKDHPQSVYLQGPEQEVRGFGGGTLDGTIDNFQYTCTK